MPEHRKNADGPAKNTDPSGSHAGFFRQLAESLPDLVLRVDASHTCTYANQAALAALGFSGEEAVGKPLHALANDPLFVQPWASAVKKVLAFGKPANALVHKDKGLPGQKTFHMRLDPETMSGETVAVMCVFRDVTQQKTDEVAKKKQLEEKETLLGNLNIYQTDLESRNDSLQSAQADLLKVTEKYADLLDNAPTGYLTIDKWGFVQQMNQTLQRWLGLDEVTASGTPVFAYNLFAKDSSKIFVRHFSEAFQSARPVSCELSLKGRGGLPLYCRLNTVAVKGKTDRLDHCRIAVTDLTEQRAAERDVINKKAKLMAFIESTEDLVFSISRKGELLLANSAFMKFFEAMYGAVPTLGGLPLRLLSEAGKQFFVETHRALLGGKHIELEQPMAGGKWFLVTARPIYESGKGVSAAAYLIRDITAKKQAEAKLAALYVRETQLKIRHEQEQSLALVKGQEDERKRIAMDLHDGVGQILTAMLMHVKILQNGLQGHASPRLAESCRMISELARAADQEIRRISGELMPTVLDGFGLAEALSDLARAVASGYEGNIHFDCRLPDKARFDPMTETAAYRIVQELFNNALKHAQAGNIWLEVEKQPGSLNIRFRDDGTGLEDFEAMARKKGSLGLRNLQQRVALLQGTFVFSSAAGQGVDCRIGLPV